MRCGPARSRLTQDDEEANQDGGEGAHAEPEDLLLLHQLAVGAGEAAGTDAGVALVGVPVDAGPAVDAGVVQALVPVLAPLPVRGHALTTWTPARDHHQ